MKTIFLFVVNLTHVYVIFYNEYYLLISQVLDQVFYVYLLFLLVSNHAGLYEKSLTFALHLVDFCYLRNGL